MEVRQAGAAGESLARSCDRSSTSSLLGQRVAPILSFKSSSSSSDTSKWKGFISVVVSTVLLIRTSCVFGWGRLASSLVGGLGRPYSPVAPKQHVSPDRHERVHWMAGRITGQLDLRIRHASQICRLR
jgi:hypothetical protein